MNTIPRSAGLGLLAYGVGTGAAFILSGAPGGNYSDSKVADYVSAGHFWIAAVVWYVSALGALGLLFAANGWRSQPGVGRLLAGLATVGAAAGVVGAFLSGGVVVAMAEGGGTVRKGVAHPVVYTITEIGNLLAHCAPALCVGVAALVLVAKTAMPGWLRGFSVIAGICGVLAPFFFTYFVFVLWTLVAGTTVVLGSGARTRAPSPAPSLV
jgi:hypothetical protein